MSGGFQLKWVILAAALGVVAGGAGVGFAIHGAGPKAEASGQLYLCPMHPTFTSHDPSDKCPICSMALVPAPAEPAPKAAAAGQLYLCPMHPTVTSEDPKATCPICSMALVPAPSAKSHEGELAARLPSVAGLAGVNIDPTRQQLIGLRTAKVVKATGAGSWRTVGRVEVDQTGVRNTNVKVDGYVEKVFVDFVGKPVGKGQPLFSLYSPMLMAAQTELLMALQTRDALGAADSKGASAMLVDSTRRRLRLWDVSEAELERLEKTREPARTLTFVSPISGVVTAKNVVEGASLKAGDMPYEITDLRHVWVMGDVYESELARVHVGMSASLALTAYPHRTFEGVVEFIDPLLDPKTRTARVHIHMPNPIGELKPEMFGELTLRGTSHEGLRIPIDAIVRAGRRDVVFVAMGNGEFQPREVELGGKHGETIEVLKGLQEGEEVVTRANFLVDSESQLRSSLQSLAPR